MVDKNLFRIFLSFYFIKMTSQDHKFKILIAFETLLNVLKLKA